MRGRPRKPTAIHILNGMPGKRPLNDAEPKPRRERPKCPAWLDKVAKTKWRQIVPELDRMGLLTVVDGDALSAYCQAWAELQHATETIQKEGRTYTNAKKNIVSHPAVAQQRTAWKAIKDFSTLFGLDPSSRTRLKVNPVKEDDPFDAFLNEKPA